MAKSTAKKEATVIKTVDELRTDLTAKQRDLLDAKRGHAAGELANPRAITSLRKDIARLHTAIRAGELQQVKESK